MSRVPATPRFKSYAPSFCPRPIELEEQSVLVKAGLKKPETRECGQPLVRMRGVMVCPVCTQLVDGVTHTPEGGMEVERVSLKERLPNRRARRAA